VKFDKELLHKRTVLWCYDPDIGPCHVSGIFLPLRVNSLPLATIYEVKIPLRKWKKSLLQRNPAQMTWAIVKQARWPGDKIPLLPEARERGHIRWKKSVSAKTGAHAPRIPVKLYITIDQ
jgi:hypothetical protein